MIKGCRKRMVIVSGLNDSSIEAAYFVMRDCKDAEKLADEDILEKANSIIENCFSDTAEFNFSRRKHKENRKNFHYIKLFLMFISGFVCGCAFFGFMNILIF